MLEGTRISPFCLFFSSTSLFVSLLSTSFGRRLKVSVFDETKIGVRPGGPAGNLGGVMERPAGFSVALLEFSFFPLLLSC